MIHIYRLTDCCSMGPAHNVIYTFIRRHPNVIGALLYRRWNKVVVCVQGYRVYYLVCFLDVCDFFPSGRIDRLEGLSTD